MSYNTNFNFGAAIHAMRNGMQAIADMKLAPEADHV